MSDKFKFYEYRNQETNNELIGHNKQNILAIYEYLISVKDEFDKLPDIIDKEVQDKLNSTIEKVKKELGELSDEVKKEVAEITEETKKEISDLQVDINNQFAKIKGDLEVEFQEFKDSIKPEIENDVIEILKDRGLETKHIMLDKKEIEFADSIPYNSSTELDFSFEEKYDYIIKIFPLGSPISGFISSPVWDTRNTIFSFDKESGVAHLGISNLAVLPAGSIPSQTGMICSIDHSTNKIYFNYFPFDSSSSAEPYKVLTAAKYYLSITRIETN